MRTPPSPHEPGAHPMLPPPEDLDRYARHLPDAGERLLAASEREQAHRHQLEGHLARIRGQELPREHARQQRTHLIVLVLGLAYLGVTTTAIGIGHAIVGVVGAALGAAALLWGTPTGARRARSPTRRSRPDK